MAEPLQKILYVEDDEDIAELTQLTLKKIGKFDIRHCPSGQEALDAFPEFKPQLVLMDVMMPGMDGLETLTHLKERPESKDTPVIFMTAKAQTHEQEKYKGMGALGVIVKPCDPVALCEHLKAYWEEYHGG